jgi:hypothetical protein
MRTRVWSTVGAMGEEGGGEEVVVGGHARRRVGRDDESRRAHRIITRPTHMQQAPPSVRAAVQPGDVHMPHHQRNTAIGGCSAKEGGGGRVVCAQPLDLIRFLAQDGQRRCGCTAGAHQLHQDTMFMSDP